MKEVDGRAHDRSSALHPLDIRILLAVTEGPVHGYRIVTSIEEKGPIWSRIYPANLYRRIRTLIRDGLMEEVDPPSNATGSRRKYFCITDPGRRLLEEEAARLHALLEEARQRGIGGAVAKAPPR